MLKLVDIVKTYRSGNTRVKALRNVTISFRKKEFVAILGASGCGKTTLLNIIGGLDHYTKGDLIINDISTKKYKDRDWDAYRNNSVGFIFQSYNLIPHISVLMNVEMSMRLSGYSRAECKKKAMIALERVGLKDQALKKPNQLSGGQMQRVAIARALVNDPEIILADEPTGALDSKTSTQILELIKEVAAEKLVIMVTHNAELATAYATRVIQIKDGEILDDSNPYDAKEGTMEKSKIKKTAMSYFSAINLSFHNIRTKKGRTFLTAFAASIGIIGIALILALSNGFQKQINAFEQTSLSQMPIMVTEQSMQMDPNAMAQYSIDSSKNALPKYTSKHVVTPTMDPTQALMHTNKITSDYIDYINKIDKSLIGGISYTKTAGMNIITKNSDDAYVKVDTMGNPQMGLAGWTVFPDTPKDSKSGNVVANNYDVLAGKIDTSKPGLILMVDSQNRISQSALKSLGITSTKNISFQDILNQTLKVIPNDAFYQNQGPIYTVQSNYKQLYDDTNDVPIHVQAILRGKKDKELITSSTGICYTGALVDKIINMNQDSSIVKFQKYKDYNVLTGQAFDTKSANSQNTKAASLAYLGGSSQPVGVYVYPKDFKSKDKITAYMDAYNKGKSKADSIQYTDMAKTISSLSGNIMSGVTIVLIALSAISLVVSCIMIGIITYISVLERTKEIGVLRALGARKRDISRVFNAETLLIGLFSGILGILIAQLLTIPVNSIVKQMSGLSNIAQQNPIAAIILIIISVLLTMLGGIIPSNIASKKDPVKALRTE